MERGNKEKLLFLDGSMPMAQVGIWEKGKWIGFYKSEEPALESLFKGVRVSLQMAGLKLKDMDAFVYCEGPGSLMGIRLAAMAIRGWKALEAHSDCKVYAYNSFEFSRKLIEYIHNPKEDYHVVSQTRTGHWNILSEAVGKVMEIREEAMGVLSGSFWNLRQKKIGVETVGVELMPFDYNLEACGECFSEGGLLREVEEPDAIFVKEPEYVKWDEKRHGKG